MSHRNLQSMKEELFVALLEGVVNGGVAFIGTWAVIGTGSDALKISGIFGALRFVSSMRELDWVTVGLDGLPTNKKLSKKELLTRSIKNVGHFI